MSDHVKLSEVCEILNSNVDKKTKENEQKVKLCNFIDVYNNWAITKYTSKKFMTATATQNEINKFSLKKGYVAITKDSETKDDIGISTYIADNFDNVLLGYHCTLLKPNQKVLNGKFLNAYLSSFYGRKYFSNCASGSGQRYTLTIDIIKDLTIPLINIETQQKIARTLSVLDQKIENNHKINELLHTLAYKIYEYYFKYKPKNAKLEQIIIENPKSSIMVKNAQKTQDKYPFFTSGDNILSYPKAIIDGRNCFLNTGGNVGIKFYVGKASYSTDTWCICANEFSDYLYLLLSSIKTHINQSFFQGTSLKHLQKNLLKKYPIYMPSTHEIKKFNQIIMPLLTLISINTRTSKKLEQIRDFLLPLLLKQQVKPQ
ncbi:hypothetical protein HpEKA13_05240 [Helicobacter pylori]